MTHPTDPLSIPHGHTAAQKLLIVDGEGIAVDVSGATGSQLQLRIRASAVEGEADLVTLEEADGLTHTGVTGEVEAVISTARWASLSKGVDYVAQFHYTGSSEFLSQPFILRVLGNFFS